jgi:hypothetical protein
VSGASLQQKIDRIKSEVSLAVDTIQAAGPVEMVIVSIADIGKSSRALSDFPDSAKRQRVTNAVHAVNIGYQEIATAKNIAFVDFDAVYASVNTRVVAPDEISVGGEKINIFLQGDEPHFFNLDDDVSVHFGTVFSGLLANKVFIEPLNQVYGQAFTPFTDQEILQNAGIAFPVRPNTPPAINLFRVVKAAADAQAGDEVTERQTINFDVTVADQENDLPHWVWFYQLGSHPAQKILKGKGVRPGFDFRIPAGTSGQTLKFSLYVTDGRENATQTALLQVVGPSSTSNFPDVRISPNPFRPDLGHTKIDFTNLPGSASVKIYTMSGQLVRHLHADANGMTSWIGAKNESQTTVASGIYLALVEGDGQTKRFKIAVER